MKKSIQQLFILFLTCSTLMLSAQPAKKRNFFPIWMFHQSNVAIHGISIGALSVINPPVNVTTNGLRIELIGGGLFTFMIPEPYLRDNDSNYTESNITERVNGMNLSLDGSVCDCKVNGLSAGFMGEIVFEVNGVSATFINNMVKLSNGIQLAAVINMSYKTRGVQIALFNFSNKLNGVQIGAINNTLEARGIQIGLWNKNEKRALPLVNWNFKNKRRNRFKSPSVP